MTLTVVYWIPELSWFIEARSALTLAEMIKPRAVKNKTMTRRHPAIVKNIDFLDSGGSPCKSIFDNLGDCLPVFFRSPLFLASLYSAILALALLSLSQAEMTAVIKRRVFYQRTTYMTINPSHYRQFCGHFRCTLIDNRTSFKIRKSIQRDINNCFEYISLFPKNDCLTE